MIVPSLFVLGCVDVVAQVVRFFFTALLLLWCSPSLMLMLFLLDGRVHWEASGSSRVVFFE